MVVIDLTVSVMVFQELPFGQLDGRHLYYVHGSATDRIHHDVRCSQFLEC